MKRRYMEKVTQTYVLEHIKSFMVGNENLITLDLANTGLDEYGIYELVSLISTAGNES